MRVTACLGSLVSLAVRDLRFDDLRRAGFFAFRLGITAGIVLQLRLRARKISLCRTSGGRQCKGEGKNTRLTGEGRLSRRETSWRAPVARSIRKTTILFEFWFSAKRNRPVGSRAKWRGSLPPVGKWPEGVRKPVEGSIWKTAMESWPRLEAKSHLPSGWMAISAASFLLEKPEGSVETR